MMQIKAPKKVIIFDLDGTLYHLRGGSYEKSPLKRRIAVNAQSYIATEMSLAKPEARRVLESIKKKYGQDISIGLEKEFGIDRYAYFDTVWNIRASDIVKKSKVLRTTLLPLKKRYTMVIVSDAPRVWINNVLKGLNVADIFRDNIFSGEGRLRKGFNNAFSTIVKTLKVRPEDCVAVGDQENTDIIPAKKLGMRAIFVHRTNSSSVADECIKSISKLPNALEKLSRS